MSQLAYRYKLPDYREKTGKKKYPGIKGQNVHAIDEPEP